MTTPSDRVRDLVRAGAIAPDEGERLLSALGEKQPTTILRTLGRPFDRFGGEVTTLLGVVVAFAAAFTTRAGLTYDGVLDLHRTQSPPSFGRALLQQLVAALLPAIVFYAYAKTAKARPRFVDVLGAAAVSRFPLVLGGLFAALVAPSDGGSKALLMAVVLLVLTGVAATLTLFYQGMKSASGLLGARLTIGVIGALVVAEIVSKVLP